MGLSGCGTGTHLRQVPRDQVEHGRKRQYLHCVWQPGGCERGSVGVTDDQGILQVLSLSTNSSEFYRIGFSAISFPMSAPQRSDEQMWDNRPWSQFCFVPGDRGAIIFTQWQSDTINWSRIQSGDAPPQEIMQLGKHSQRVRVVAVNEEGTHAASGSDDGALSLWQLQTLSEHRIIEGAHEGATTSLHFHGNFFFSAGTDQRVKWWSVESGDLLSDFVTHDSPVLDMASAVGLGAAGQSFVAARVYPY